MKYIRTLTLAAGALGVSGLACSSSDSAPKTTLSAVVAPLDLPAATDACYHLTVWNDVSDLSDDTQVWDQPVLCASQYGANNGIRFTGICDAEAGLGDLDPSNDGKNAIRLILNDIYKNGDVDSGTALTAGEDYVNPCPAPESGEDNGCVLVADCTQNQDTKIEFNLTVMRQATLGFFDTVVKLQDIFCAAKLDCEDQDDQTLSYLYNESTQADGPTAVLAFTCVGGAGDLFMYLDDIVITCTDGTTTRTATVDPSEGPGNIGHIESDAGAPILFGAAVNTGDGFQGSRYWNVLLGTNFAGAGETCTLQAVGTASKTELGGTPFETPEHTRYPFIQWNVVLSEDGQRECSKHPLNGDDGAVSTHYTDIDAPQLLAHKLALQEPTVICPCWNVDEAIAFREGASQGSQQWLDLSNGRNAFDQSYPEGGSFSAHAYLGGNGNYCTVNGPTAPYNPYTNLSGISDAEAAQCKLDVLRIAGDLCGQNNGGCPGSAPICQYVGPSQVRCAECSSSDECGGATPICDLGSSYTNPALKDMCVACAAPAYDCASGSWCGNEGDCEAPPTFVELDMTLANTLSSLEDVQAACAAQGGRRMAESWELMAAMTAQFAHGTSIPGVTFQSEVYYGAPGWGGQFNVWQWNGGLGGPWNGGWGNGSHFICIP